ncbi:MAG: HNH endonuclease [Bdellovibrionota bacterium]
MNLKHLTADALLASTDRAVQDERSALSVVLQHLREVDRRRLYSKLKYKSLKDYAMKRLKYSEGAAGRRIAAMIALKELPQLGSKIDDGSLNLTNLGLARSFFALEEKAAVLTAHPESTDLSPSPAQDFRRTQCEKLAVLEKLENVSKAEAIAILERETGVTLPASESTRVLGEDRIEMTTIATKEAFELNERLKGLLAHSHPGMTNGELLEMALKALQKEVDPLAKAERVTAKKQKAKNAHALENPPLAAKRCVTNPHYIPAAVRHHVWLRDGGACTNCGSTHAVQHEHIIPVALGGESTTENVKLLCRSCNQRSAIEQFGVGKMTQFLERSKSVAPKSVYQRHRSPPGDPK